MNSRAGRAESFRVVQRAVPLRCCSARRRLWSCSDSWQRRLRERVDGRLSGVDGRRMDGWMGEGVKSHARVQKAALGLRTGHGGGSETENGTPTKCRDKSLIATD